MNSLQGRLFLASSLILAVFIAIGALSLDRAFYEGAERALNQKLQGLIYNLLGATEITPQGTLTLDTASLLERELPMLKDELYAAIFTPQLELLWRSNPDLDLVLDTPVKKGEWRFWRKELPDGKELFLLALGVQWATEAEGDRFVIVAGEDGTFLNRQVSRFRRVILSWLLTVALLLLGLQMLVLYWGLRPLQRVVGELRAIESGDKTRIDVPYPQELRPLVVSLNALLRQERNRQKRYRNALDNLAHSLKTPLAVLSSLLEQGAVSQPEQGRMEEQVTNMGQIVSYQLQKAATAGGQVLSPPQPVRPLVDKVINALSKVYRDKAVCFTVELPDTLTVRADPGDLLELLGNVLDNAAKWCRQEVQITTEVTDTWWILQVMDDGSGFQTAHPHKFLRRGVRADRRVEGQGIGLAVAVQIVRAYDGKLELGAAPQGGARATILLPAEMTA